MGCFSDLELNHASIDVSKYINQSSSEMAVRSGACSASLTKKRECLCEHSGECRVHNSGSWSCDCSKTGYTGQRCEQLASHLDLSEIATLEVNTQLQWSEQISDIAFNLRVRLTQLSTDPPSSSPSGCARRRELPARSTLSSIHQMRLDRFLHPQRPPPDPLSLGQHDQRTTLPAR